MAISNLSSVPARPTSRLGLTNLADLSYILPIALPKGPYNSKLTVQNATVSVSAPS